MRFWIPVWTKAPFLRLLAAFIVGIVMQWQLQLPISTLSIGGAAAVVMLVIYHLLNMAMRFRLRTLVGVAVSLLLIVLGAFVVWKKDIRNHTQWFGHQYNESTTLVLRLDEPPVEKPNSFKAFASVIGLHHRKSLQPVEGRVILYFKKDSSIKHLAYGSIITTSRPLQAIRNAGNPGGFNYQRYCLFQGITHQVYLTTTDFTPARLNHSASFRQFIFNTRKRVLAILQQYIAGDKEAGLAQALLIGYKDDLDKNLVQSYTNTGVVHVIAISGLHLGLIYWLLLLLTKPMGRNRWSKWLRLLTILTGLWVFAILAGAQASVVRSAVMFSVIATGEALSKRSSILNTLALSAFGLLCYNPFWLWDVGFQLSYAALLSIVLFFQPIYNWFDFQNKAIDFVWKLNAVTLAAQVLTLPLSIYHFHQVPTLFLLSNMVAVPLSSLILLGEILLCAVSWLPAVAVWLGLLLRKLIEWMNRYVEHIDGVSFAVWDGLSINFLQFFFITGFAVAFCFWWMEKRKTLLWTAAACLLAFSIFRSYSFIQAQQQRKLIVYNVPKRKAIDIINGRTCVFIGDDQLMLDDFTRNFHIQPSRVLHRVDSLNTSHQNLTTFTFGGKRVSLIDEQQDLPVLPHDVDVLVLSKNPKLYLTKLTEVIKPGQIIIDGSVPQWKARLWKKTLLP